MSLTAILLVIMALVITANLKPHLTNGSLPVWVFAPLLLTLTYVFFSKAFDVLLCLDTKSRDAKFKWNALQPLNKEDCPEILRLVEVCNEAKSWRDTRVNAGHNLTELDARLVEAIVEKTKKLKYAHDCETACKQLHGVTP